MSRWPNPADLDGRTMAALQFSFYILPSELNIFFLSFLLCCLFFCVLYLCVFANCLAGGELNVECWLLESASKALLHLYVYICIYLSVCHFPLSVCAPCRACTFCTFLIFLFYFRFYDSHLKSRLQWRHSLTALLLLIPVTAPDSPPRCYLSRQAGSSLFTVKDNRLAIMALSFEYH